MADNQETEAPIIVAPSELAGLYDQLYKREWATNAFKNPTTVMRSLLHYGRLAANRIVDAFNQISALSVRVTSLEKFRADLETQAAQFEAHLQQQAAEPSPVAPEVTPGKEGMQVLGSILPKADAPATAPTDTPPVPTLVAVPAETEVASPKKDKKPASK